LPENSIKFHYHHSLQKVLKGSIEKLKKISDDEVIICGVGISILSLKGDEVSLRNYERKSSFVVGNVWFLGNGNGEIIVEARGRKLEIY
jgi:hypothetical protein